MKTKKILLTLLLVFGLVGVPENISLAKSNQEEGSHFEKSIYDGAATTIRDGDFTITIYRVPSNIQTFAYARNYRDSVVVTYGNSVVYRATVSLSYSYTSSYVTITGLTVSSTYLANGFTASKTNSSQNGDPAYQNLKFTVTKTSNSDTAKLYCKYKCKTNGDVEASYRTE